ncbi:MAG TPA: rod shape-determining protein MreD [Deltaproteobacteria bacterium]|nr:MAG: rod shape-determining protein MreD [Deltaproteobacteria bacterium GWA2_55_82]OGQ62191.1 MAG: rod shape-determining protein MreD [Deltaproteobacteria bacterium RIFCSPLOWO2_02_FULL_55_12]OIJ73232.1 MAG: rod shape-determining protein MreD [Deltaproteobacteria bacterium GWC2_55_46]HBG45507.1 rod shape-determining protein MreD [Deltaproteobacteria bacterium]HCY10338.1 rod shape-determining protein MreD [Deltaproteobacteria bacterium]
MKEFILFLPLTIAYLALKSTLFPGIPLPDVPLIIVFYMAYRKASAEGAISAFALGYLDDAFSGGIIGTSSFALIVIFLAVRYLAWIVQFTTPAIRAAGVFAAALMKGALTYYALKVTDVDVYFFSGVVLAAMVTAFLAPAVIALLQKITSLVTSHKFKDSEN